MFQLKPLSKDAVPAALEKAMRYRLLNEPAEAESICRDVLECDPDNQEALTTLILALTDQFGGELASSCQEAQELVAQLASEYDRAYYAGIICERRAKAHLRQGTPGSGDVAHDWLIRAMHFYEDAESLRPEGNDDAILRWNTCVRLLAKFPELRPYEASPAAAIDLE